MWYKKSDKKIYYQLREIQMDFPNISFPEELTSEVLSNFGIEIVQPSKEPEFDPIKEILEETLPKKINGVFVQSWKKRTLSPDEIEKERGKLNCLGVDVKLRLLEMELLDELESWLETQPRKTRIEYDGTPLWNRNWHVINKFKEDLNLSDETIDNLFR
jgi:hypothetical protein